MKNSNLMVKKEDDRGVNDRDKADSVNTMPSHFGSYFLSEQEIDDCCY